MKSSTDFQTGSILLLTATLVCIGLAITVIAPVIDSPLARSARAQPSPSGRPAAKTRSDRETLAEFYPPVSKGHEELARSRRMTGSGFRNFRHQQPGPGALPSARAPAFSPMLNSPSSVASSQRNDGAPRTDFAAAEIPGHLPYGAVYAPITIHQPAINEGAATQENLSSMAERIERLVTERERLASALEFEKQRQSEIARRERRKRAGELQQQQIAKLEMELKSLNRSMSKMQSETSTQLTRLSEQNAQIDVASQALNAYREALDIVKAESANSAAQGLPPRTAEADPEAAFGTAKPTPDQDDAGRVRIPELPPMPRYQYGTPTPLKPLEQKPQTAKAPLKRLRVSSPSQTFEPPEPEAQLLPLPAAGDLPTTPPTRNKTESVQNESAETSETPQPEMEFIPLEAPRIREFQSNLNPPRQDDAESRQNKVSERQPRKRRVISQTARHLDVAFEHIYQFDSIPVAQESEEMETPVLKAETEKQRVEQGTAAISKQIPLKFEPIEFPDLTPVARPAPNRLRPVSAKRLLPEPIRQLQGSSAKTTQAAGKQSFIPKQSDFPGPNGERASENDSASLAKPSATRLGGRGQNRHLQRQPAQTGSLRIPIFPGTQNTPQSSEPAAEKPSLLQRISHTLKGRGSRAH